MTIAQRIAEYLKKHDDIWIRPSCLAAQVDAKISSVSCALSKLHEDGVVQRRPAKFAQGAEYALAKKESA